MVGVIFGQKGSGKTKKILELANRAAKEAHGSIVFIDDENSYMYDLDRNVRFVNAKEYDLVSPRMLYGFLCGLAASDYDLEYIYIDGLMRFIRTELSTLTELFATMSETLSGRISAMALATTRASSGLEDVTVIWKRPVEFTALASIIRRRPS